MARSLPFEALRYRYDAIADFTSSAGYIYDAAPHLSLQRSVRPLAGGPFKRFMLEWGAFAGSYNVPYLRRLIVQLAAAAKLLPQLLVAE